METTQTSIGTSPDVLQHYLTAGITIRHTRFDLAKRLELGSLHPEGLLFDSMWKWEYADALPELYGFRALCDPLPDGSIPAVEVIRACVASSDNFKDYEFNWAKATAELWQPAKHRTPDYWQAKIWIPVEGGGGLSAFISNDWLFSAFDRVDKWYLPGYEALRRLHFAVGLNASQFIEKASASPTQEGKRDE